MKILILQTGATKTDRGFTILEFLVVICIAGIMSTSIALWMGNAFGRSELTKIAAQLEVEFSGMARQAKQTGRDRIVYIRRTPSSTDFMFGERAIRIVDPVTAGWVAAAEVGSSDELGAIVFFGAGGASGGTLELAEGKLKTSISIDWLTARIRVAENNS